MTTRNPFPGMNPYFEQQWRDAHTMLIAYLRDSLQERLPADLVARAEEEETVTIGASERAKKFRPDVTVSKPWTLKEPALAAVGAAPAIPAAEPIRVCLDEDVERWLEIREATGRLVTAIELLSPSNKLHGAGREAYVRKRRRFMESGANLVEIDLVRQGSSVFAAPVRLLLQEKGARYAVAVFRTTRLAEQELYPIRLRERLPVIRVPLRTTDADVTVDLQPLVDQCHERGRYHFLNYRAELEPPLPADDASWAEGLLRQRELV